MLPEKVGGQSSVDTFLHVWPAFLYFLNEELQHPTVLVEQSAHTPILIKNHLSGVTAAMLMTGMIKRSVEVLARPHMSPESYNGMQRWLPYAAAGVVAAGFAFVEYLQGWGDPDVVYQTAACLLSAVTLPRDIQQPDTSLSEMKISE